MEQGNKNRAAAPPFSNLQNCRGEHERKPGFMKTELLLAPTENVSPWITGSHVARFVTITQKEVSFFRYPLTLTNASNPSGYSGNQTTGKIFSLLKGFQHFDDLQTSAASYGHILVYRASQIMRFLQITTNPAPEKPLCTVFPTAFSLFMSVCLLLVILAVFPTFSLL